MTGYTEQLDGLLEHQGFLTQVLMGVANQINNGATEPGGDPDMHDDKMKDLSEEYAFWRNRLNESYQNIDLFVKMHGGKYVK